MQVAIASGKGGTGKTTLATNLAIALSSIYKVQLLDCDVEEPNCHLFLPLPKTHNTPVCVPIPKVDLTQCNGCGLCAQRCAFSALSVVKGKVLFFTELCHSCGGCSLFCPQQAIGEISHPIGVLTTGQSEHVELAYGTLDVGVPMAPPLIKAVLSLAKDTEVVIVDAPPGTSCSVIAALEGADCCILVTEPTPYGLNDLRLAVELTRELNIVTGVVINKSDMGGSLVKEYCTKHRIPVLCELPFSRQVAKSYAKGELVQQDRNWHILLNTLWERIERIVVHARNTRY